MPNLKPKLKEPEQHQLADGDPAKTACSAKVNHGLVQTKEVSKEVEKEVQKVLTSLKK